MEYLIQFLNALWIQDFGIPTNSSTAHILYFILFTILFLENGFLPVAFLPGDSLLILVGTLCAKGVITFFNTVILLTVASSLGCWISYLQGKWLGNKKIVKNWLAYLPMRYHRITYLLFYKHGLSALLVGRFISFVRTILPIIAGLSDFSNIYFQLFNWVSSFLWVFVLTTCGFLLGRTSTFLQYEDQLTFFLIFLPIGFLILGVTGSVVIFWKKRKRK